VGQRVVAREWVDVQLQIMDAAWFYCAKWVSGIFEWLFAHFVGFSLVAQFGFLGFLHVSAAVRDGHIGGDAFTESFGRSLLHKDTSRVERRWIEENR
jgi:hypothetical protein